MGEEQQQPAGPDLRQGVDAGDVPEGGILAGHVDGEAVVVARAGGELFAVDGHCTHYHVELGGGLLVGETLRCPAHYARFSLRTGEALHGPAFNPLGCWRVEERDGRVFVTGKGDCAERPRAALPAQPESVVIVGAGAAGGAAAEMLRREGYRGPVTLIDAGEDGPVDRPNLSKDYLTGGAPDEWIPLWPREFFVEHEIELLLGSRVVGIDAQARTVKLMNGRTLAYGALLLANGADPVRLPIPTHKLTHVHYLRTWADARAIARAAESARRAVVAGASFIGLEVAASLRTRGVEVDVVFPDRVPMEKVLGPEVGAFLRRLHEEHGVRFHPGQTPAAIDEQSVTLKDGTRIEADMVVVGIGVRPGVALASWAGIKMEGGAVLVDEYLQTSVPGIWAAGDITRWPDPWTGERITSEHWVVAERQGQTAARNLLGRREPFRAVPFFWSQHYDVVIHYIGHAERWDAAEIDGSLEARDATIVYRRGGRPHAIATVSRERVSLAAEAAIEAGDAAGVEAALADAAVREAVSA